MYVDGVSPPPPPLKKLPLSLRKKSGLKVTNVGGKLKNQWDAEKSRAPSFHCKICMKSYQTPIEVRDCVEAHKEGSNLEEPTKCTTCDETLLSRYVVTDHFSKKHRDLLFGQMCCPICMKMFPLKQVWSLTQFYSVDFSNSRIGVKKCVFNKHTIKVCISCCSS